MSKQDRQGVRNATDIERKYNFDKNFATVMGIATDAQRAAERLHSDIDAELSLKVSVNDNDKIVSMLNASADTITIKGDRLIIESTNFELTADGKVIAKAGTIGGCSIVNGALQIKNANIAEKLTASKIDATNLKVRAANITGTLTASQIDAKGMNVAGFTVTEDALTYEGEDEEGMGVSIELNTGTYPLLSLGTLHEDGSLHRATTIDSTGIKIHKESGAAFNGGWLTLVAGNVAYFLYLDHDTGTVKFRTLEV